MTTEAAPLAIVGQPQAAAEALRSAANYAQASRSAATQRGYQSDWDRFVAWCQKHGTQALPCSPGALAAHVATLADEGLRPATIDRALTAISRRHVTAGFPSPRAATAVRETMAGIRRKLGTKQQQKAPLLLRDLRRACAGLPDTLQGHRDRALLTVGFFGAFRREELVGIQLPHLQWVPEGVIVHLGRTKTDQEGQGRPVAIPLSRDPNTCPVRALRAWLDISGIQDGHVFRGLTKYGLRVRRTGLTDRWVALTVKRVVGKQLGVDEEPFAGHSLRAGFVTSAVAAGKPIHKIKAQTGHKSDKILQKYIRDAGLFESNAADL